MNAVQSEKQFQGAVLELAQRLRWRTAHFNDSRRQIRPGVFVGDTDAAGWPDLVLCRPPRLLIVELKADKGRVSAAQVEWLQALTLCGIETAVWRPSDWPVIEATLRLAPASSVSCPDVSPSPTGPEPAPLPSSMSGQAESSTADARV